MYLYEIMNSEGTVYLYEIMAYNIYNQLLVFGDCDKELDRNEENQCRGKDETNQVNNCNDPGSSIVHHERMPGDGSRIGS